MNQIKIGNFIAEMRKENKLTQANLSERLGVTDRSISNWENGKCMPDLSLFKPLCQELNISINELLSGERINKEQYQEKFEENIINLTNENKKRTKKRFMLLIIISIIIFFVCLIGMILYNTIELEVDYDDRLMKCNFNDNKLVYQIIGVSVLKTDYIERVIDNEKYLIFHSTINLYNKRRSNWEYGKTFREFDKEDNKYQNVVIYYTNKSLKKLNKMKDDEFKSELKKSYQMCNLY